MGKASIFVFLFCVLHGGAFAAVKGQDVEYKDGQVLLEGYLVYDDSTRGKRPGILVFHEWNGLGSFVK